MRPLGPVWLLVFLGLAAPDPVRAGELSEAALSPQAGMRDAAAGRAEFDWDTCRRIEVSARMFTLPPAFLARVIWRESLFDPSAVSPAGAQGIAQFMPATARHRRLEDPFDPKYAIPASAHYLSDLRNRFGNLGLAAAAYNAGPGRVADWRAGISGLPAETWNYVTAITGFSPDIWNGAERPRADYDLDRKLSFLSACRKLPIRPLREAPVYASAQWQPWGAHLTADWSQRKALSRYAGLQRKYPEILAGLAPMVLRVVNPHFGRRARFEIRIGQPDRAEAIAFCRRMRSAGGGCLATRTERR